MEELSVVYYGYVFDASGYGHAARGYIRALHSAGVELSVINLANGGRQVRDPLIESLLGCRVDPDFHLFHGIPPQWARLAFRLRNAIGMTVWETDTMPSQWRNVLNHTLEVWLPCEFNVSVFSRALERPVFRLPHPLVEAADDARPRLASPFADVGKDDFLFYSILEWQERKSPEGLIESFLRAFPNRKDAVLFIKCNPGAAAAAQSTVQNLRRTISSRARVVVKAEAWEDAQIRALHERGDCYVSLHRGEGWGYPLFEAAGLGKPVIATEYAGPLDYLDAQEHNLVRQRPGAVRQRYLYYNATMNWAEPDLDHATELMRWVFENREEARARAAAGASRIQSRYSLGTIGEMAKHRLISLLKETRPDRWKEFGQQQRAKLAAPTVPIPGEWYDEDYFENGLKSNWDQGYTWRVFSNLFNDTADFLTGVFPEAASYLDAGCAKGFLVRALRERGKDCWGFDHSRWAITRAEESVRSFVTQGNAESVSFDRRFDILTAFSLLESLTEEQAIAFLSHAREWTNQCLLASIPSFDDEEDERRRTKVEDRDLSHITMKTRQWWHELLLDAGWRQDAIHRIAQQTLQRHELPSRMGWKLYLYVPGVRHEI